MTLRNRTGASGARRQTLFVSICLALAAAPLAVGAQARDSAAVETPDGAEFKRRSANQLDQIEVEANPPHATYDADETGSATRTQTDLRDIPQQISVITQDLMRDQAITSMADAVRYVPGMGMAQGEGNRDTPIFRGNGSTADFFIDGMRDDVQYFRDVYNIERVEILKGPNAMIFGRGGSGGVLNRVTKIADWSDMRDFSLQLGSHDRRRVTADIGGAPSDRVALRANAMYEDSGSYRDGVGVERYGFNPTMSVEFGERTSASFGIEHFSDERIADRGIPSFQGRPLETEPSRFFGNAALSPVDAQVDAFTALVEHEFENGLALRNRTRWADYDKFYQNVFPGAASADGSTVSISAYNNATQRENLINQTDLMFTMQAGSIEHALLAGAEFGTQDTDNQRQTGYFPAAAAGGAERTSISVPVRDPVANLPIVFRPSATDANNSGTADVAAVYVQDQITFSPRWQAILGLRLDQFDVDFRNHRNDVETRSDDTLLSPRAGLVFRPIDALSLYASYSIAYQPRAGEQLSSLSPTNAALDPEKFRNYEVGAKWDVGSNLTLNAAIYRLDRSNVVVTDPTDPTRSLLVDGQRTRGFELEAVGEITDTWHVIGGYAWADGEITRALSSTAPAGNSVAQLPEHTFSLWNRFDLGPQWGVGIGAIHRGESFTSTDNLVTLPSYTRLDAALFYDASENVQFQINAENLLDREYYPNAHSNNNITPGSPRAAYLSVSLRY